MKEFVPNKLKDFVGNRQAHEQLLEQLRNGRNVYLTGPPGCGKTAAVHVASKELGYGVLEWNASDERRAKQLEEILRLCKLPSLTGQRMVILLDEVDGISAWATMKKIVKSSVHPVVLTANRDRVPEEVRGYLVHIKLRRPRTNEVGKYISKLAGGKEVDLSRVTNDVRNSIIAAMYGSETYSEVSVFRRVNDLFTRGVADGITKDDYIWLLSNAQRYLSGVELCDFIDLLDVASRSSPLVLGNVPVSSKGGYPRYPSYFRKVASYRRRKKG